MFESQKSMRRRYVEHHTGVFPWMDLFKGVGLDVGCGPDKVPFDNFRGWDVEDGDANHLSQYFHPESFDLLHASQCLEHLHDPRAVIADWLTLVKPGGYIVVTVPDMYAYEGGHWPSKWNGDHKSTWSMIYRGSKAPIHVHIPTFLAEFSDRAEVLLARLVDTSYDYRAGTSIDQTYDVMAGVEAWCEFVLRKKE